MSVLTRVAMASMSSTEEPFHPSVSFAFPKRMFGSRYRSCQSQWFQEFTFLSDVEKDAVFGHTCVKAIVTIVVRSMLFRCCKLIVTTINCG